MCERLASIILSRLCTIKAIKVDGRELNKTNHGLQVVLAYLMLSMMMLSDLQQIISLFVQRSGTEPALLRVLENAW